MIQALHETPGKVHTCVNRNVVGITIVAITLVATVVVVMGLPCRKRG